MRTIEAVLFDLDDTLHDDTTAYRRAARRVSEDVARERGVAAETVEAAYIAEAEGFWHRLAPTDLTISLKNVRAQLWSRALARVTIEDEALALRCAHDYDAYRRENFVLFPGVLEFLRALRKSGKRIGLVTNGFAETHNEKITRLELRGVLDAIFLPDEVGMLKPDPRLFAHACEVLGVEPQTTVMVGDRYERDIRGAMQAGLFTIWVNVREEELPTGAPPPDATVASILDVAAVLDAASLPAPRGS